MTELEKLIKEQERDMNSYRVFPTRIDSKSFEYPADPHTLDESGATRKGSYPREDTLRGMGYEENDYHGFARDDNI